MFYIGLDIHTTHTTVCVLDQYGKVFQRHQAKEFDDVIKFIKTTPGHFKVCYEASTGYGRYFELLDPIADYVAVAHPGSLTLIFRSKKKNDKADAQKLAKLLYLDEVPTVYVPKIDIRSWRGLITFRSSLISKRTRAKNGIRALLRTVCIKAPQRPGLWTLKGMVWLKQLEFSQLAYAFTRDMLVEQIETFCSQIKRVEKELLRFSKNNAAVQLLQSIPGVGLRTAESFVAWMDDPHRFKNSKQVGAYFGLVPTQDQSGNTNRLGHITRQGSPVVRHMVVEAVWQAVRRSATIKAYFQRIERDDKKRKKIAIVATAHYLVPVMWSMLKKGTEWKETVQETEREVHGMQAPLTSPTKAIPD